MTNLKLDYAPRRSRRWRLMAICCAAAILAAIIGGRWGWSRWPGWCRRYYLNQCLRYQGNPGIPAVGQPECLRRLDPNLENPMSETVFMHLRTSHSGIQRLVRIEAFPFENPPDRLAESLGITLPSQSLNIELWTYDPADMYVYGFLICTYQGGLSNGFWPIGEGRKLTVSNGEPDTVDSSHFTFKYALDGASGTIDGWLLDDSSVKVQMRDGPAATTTDDLGQSPLHN